MDENVKNALEESDKIEKWIEKCRNDINNMLNDTYNYSVGEFKKDNDGKNYSLLNTKK